MDKKLTDEQIRNKAKQINVPYAALKAVIEVECKGSGFFEDGQPTILFERHIFRRRLIENKQEGIVSKVEKERPDLCNKTAGGYGKLSEQHKKLQDAVKYHRQSALESASWGIGQVMGFHWEYLGYPSLQSFINLMYRNEEQQLDAMCRYIVKTKLDETMRKLDWAAFAKGYNGIAYKKNKYDEKLAEAYKKYK